MKDKAKLPYTEAVIQEIQRMGAVAPQIIPHETLDDVTISGYLVPKGTLVSVTSISCFLKQLHLYNAIRLR